MLLRWHKRMRSVRMRLVESRRALPAPQQKLLRRTIDPRVERAIDAARIEPRIRKP